MITTVLVEWWADLIYGILKTKESIQFTGRPFPFVVNTIITVKTN